MRLYDSLAGWRRGSFFEEKIPYRARAYILFLIFASIPIFFYSLYHSLAKADSDLRWLYLAAFTGVASCFPVKIPLTKGKTGSLSITVTVSDVFIFAAILLFGPSPAVVIAVVEGVITNFRVKVKRLYKHLFNLAQLIVTSFIVSQAFYQLKGTPAPPDPSKVSNFAELLIVVGLFGLLYFMLSSGIVALAMALVTNQPFRNIWKQNFIWASLTHFASASLGALIFIYFWQIEVFSIAVAAPIISLLYFAYKMNLDRVEEANQHLERVNELLSEKIEAEGALQKAKEELEVIVRARTTELRLANEQLRLEIRERLEAEKELAAEKERLAVTLLSIGDGVIATDTDGRVLLINKIAEELTGWVHSEAASQEVTEVFRLVDKKTGQPRENPVSQVLQSGQLINFDSKDTVILSKNGLQKNISLSAGPIRHKTGVIVGMVIAFRDITRQKLMEEEILKNEKLESLGILAGGLAHDFNNILSGILLKAQLAQRSFAKGKDPIQFLNSIEQGAQMAAGLTQQLLTFAKGGAPVKKIAPIKKLIYDSTNFALRGSNVRCIFHVSEDLWTVEMDEGQINQVMNNLVINAQQAMPEGGTVTVRAENIEVSEHSPVADLPYGPYVRVAVQDAGRGIAPEDLPRIFDPYFTTKPKGHGLGLASTYSIIQKHNGYIAVESDVMGTVFTFLLPASRLPVQEKPVEEGLADGSGRVLIMDDEEVIRDSMGELLQDLGYKVGFAADGTEAITLYKEGLANGNPFDVVIMDLTIPGGMGGKETIRKLLEIDPEAKAVVSSGYSNDPIMANYREHGFSGVLVKPLKIQDLGRVLSQILKTSPPIGPASPQQSSGWPH